MKLCSCRKLRLNDSWKIGEKITVTRQAPHCCICFCPKISEELTAALQLTMLHQNSYLLCTMGWLWLKQREITNGVSQAVTLAVVLGSLWRRCQVLTCYVNRISAARPIAATVVKVIQWIGRSTLQNGWYCKLPHDDVICFTSKAREEWLLVWYWSCVLVSRPVPAWSYLCISRCRHVVDLRIADQRSTQT